MLALALLFGGLAAVWAMASVIDLHDGRTWTDRNRRDRGPLFRRVEAATEPSTFKMIVVLRGVMPTVLLATGAVVCSLGFAAQPKVHV